MCSFFKNIFQKSIKTPDIESIRVDVEPINVIDRAITFTILKECFVSAKSENIQKYIPYFISAFKKYDVNTIERISAFLSQCSHESGQFNRISENLNYSATSLVKVWPKHFPTLSFAQQYHRQPEKIANRAYANRMLNGNEASGDGWKYRGRGIIQITGKFNYKSVSKFIEADVVLKPDLLLKPDCAVLSAMWFWHTHSLNQFADSESVITITKKINGGTHGLADRQNQYNHCKKILIKHLT